MAAAMRAGVPQMPVTVMLDQPHNARLCVALGLAPAWLPFTRLTASRLAKQLRVILTEPRDGPLHRAASAVAALVRAESAHSANMFCDIIEEARPLDPTPHHDEHHDGITPAADILAGGVPTMSRPLVTHGPVSGKLPGL
eukprot:CAMPEP_0181189800 /NCGR_PEP_ID=MMETSP1096-20121128/11856_1 /TAXON_ID=156174 ORGANISM="Chrysochromulina ericina, Strain CCMP281" /NCGR_SAMPLE_ID=MMETSP1096 /ASSEMBLY_ACC=CAM_ASM_000453 /LENGTH=139 /DNA_ID=CAMNT_0023278979 /DNA_START=54 /DNA_END=473 /DNA_ORIENTATION=+